MLPPCPNRKPRLVASSKADGTIQIPLHGRRKVKAIMVSPAAIPIHMTAFSRRFPDRERLAAAGRGHRLSANREDCPDTIERRIPFRLRTRPTEIDLTWSR